MLVDVADVMVMRSCMCGPHRCPYCKKKVANNRCTPIPFDVLRCPHCGYPTHSKKIEPAEKK